MASNNYPVLIIGAGPAGLSAAIFCRRANLPTVILEKLSPGGQILTSPHIENYPGFPGKAATQQLMAKMVQQVEKLGAEWQQETVMGVEGGHAKTVQTEGDKTYTAHAIIIATGAYPATLGVAGEHRLTGRGVSYCATCDGPFFRDKVVGVVGGGNTAAEEALYLTRFARKVYLIHRRDQLRADAILGDRLLKHDRIEILWSSILKEIHGSSLVEAITIQNVNSKQLQRIECSGVFIYVGIRPNTSFLHNNIQLNQQGFIVTDEQFQTSIPGIFACGDVRANLLKQVVVAAGEGAQAAVMASRYLENKGFI